MVSQLNDLVTTNKDKDNIYCTRNNDRTFELI